MGYGREIGLSSVGIWKWLEDLIRRLIIWYIFSIILCRLCWELDSRKARMDSRKARMEAGRPMRDIPSERRGSFELGWWQWRLRSGWLRYRNHPEKFFKEYQYLSLEHRRRLLSSSESESEVPGKVSCPHVILTYGSVYLIELGTLERQAPYFLHPAQGCTD